MREIELKSSRWLGLLLLGMAALALAAVALAALPATSRLVLAVGVIGLVAWRWRRARSACDLRIKGDGRLQCRDGRGEWCDIEVLGDSLVSTALVVLRYRMASDEVRSLVLLPDSADADDLRRLRVSLRWIRRTRSDTASQDAG